MPKACLMNQATDVCKYGNTAQTRHHEWDTFCCVKFTRSVSKRLNKKEKNICLKKVCIKKKKRKESSRTVSRVIKVSQQLCCVF